MISIEDMVPENGSRRIAITGSGGRLGGALVRLFEPHHQVTALNRDSINLSDLGNVSRVLKELDFDVLINPAAMTSVDQCESLVEEAKVVNSLAPGAMAEICRDKGARFVHVSTDYVFGGEEPGMRGEGDPAHPLGVYGATKLQGEQIVLQAEPRSLVVRTSWVFGPERPAFPDSIVKRAMRQDRVEAISDKWSAPTYTDDFARLLYPLLWQDSLGGVFHLCNSGSCNWQEYGQAALDSAAGAGLSLKTAEVQPLLLADMDLFSVSRPVHTAMDTSKYSGLGHGSPRHWREALDEYLVDQIRQGKFAN